jgi:solute carrier family 35 protein F1/2
MDTSKHDRASEGKISSADEAGESTPSTSQPALVAPEVTPNAPEIAGNETDESGNDWFAYLKTRNFHIVLALGYVEASGLGCSKLPLIIGERSQILALAITSTNTFTSLLVGQGTSIPAFQTFFNYVLLNIVYTSYTLYSYGFRKWYRLLLKDGWKCTA